LVVPGVLALEAPPDGLGLGLCLRAGHPGRQPGEHAQGFALAVLQARGQIQRRPQLGVADPERRELEPRRHDADDGVGLAVEGERLADDLRISAEAPLPQPMGEHHGGRRPRLIVAGTEGAAEGRRDPQHREHVGRDLQGPG
jgi:hypothetical protein